MSEEDTERWNVLEREGHSLMYYGPQRWDAGWGVQPTPRDAVDAMRHDECRVVSALHGSDGFVRCRRPTGHAGMHFGFIDPDVSVEWHRQQFTGEAR